MVAEQEKSDCLQIGHVHVTRLLSAACDKLHSFSIRVMVPRKQHLKRISALATDGKSVAKRVRQSQNRRASLSPSNLDNYDQDNSVNNIESPPKELV